MIRNSNTKKSSCFLTEAPAIEFKSLIFNSVERFLELVLVLVLVIVLELVLVLENRPCHPYAIRYTIDFAVRKGFITAKPIYKFFF